MNRFFRYLLCFTLLLLMVSSFAFAEEEIKIRFDGDFVETDAPPVIIDGRTLVPLRDTFNLFNFEVDWDPNTKTAIGRKGEFEIRMPIGNTNVTVGGIKFELDVPAQLINNRTYIPVRFVSERIGAEVRWHSALNSVEILTTPLKQEVLINDPRLKDYLLELIGKTTSDDILKSDLRFIQNLQISDMDIYRLDGVEHMIYVVNIDASDNNIENLTPIQDLNYIKKLNLSNNRIHNTTDLKSLTTINYLNLKDNDLNGISSLKELWNINELYLSGNKLSYDNDLIPLYYFPKSLVTDIDRDKIEAPDYDTWNLRGDAYFELEVAPDIFWVPAAVLGSSDNKNEDFDDIIRNSPQGKSVKINNLYELLQFLEESDLTFINDDQKIEDSKNQIWSYHRTPESTLNNFKGSDKAISIASAYLLRSDYAQNGVVTIITDDFVRHNLNYIYDGYNYYIYYPKTYLKENLKTNALESGLMMDYENSNKKLSNVHKVDSIMNYVDYIYGDSAKLVYKIDVFSDETISYPEAIYDTNDRNMDNYHLILPEDRDGYNRGDNFWNNSIEVLKDTPDDNFLIRFTENRILDPVWD